MHYSYFLYIKFYVYTITIFNNSEIEKFTQKKFLLASQNKIFKALHL